MTFARRHRPWGTTDSTQATTTLSNIGVAIAPVMFMLRDPDGNVVVVVEEPAAVDEPAA